MISIFQAVILGLIQGLTELFPISSLGHSVFLPRLFDWDLHQDNKYYLTFLVATHLATAMVLLLFFWRDWVAIARGLVRSFATRRIDPGDTYARLGWLLVVGTVPVGVLGLLFDQYAKQVFGSAQIAAAFLIVNGLILFAAERLRKRRVREERKLPDGVETLAKLKWSHAFSIGAIQAAALIPGISRSGSSMAGGLLVGLDNEGAARFSFLLATPAIGAAALLKLPDLFTVQMAPQRPAIMLGALAAGVSAYLSVKFLMRYFQTQTLMPFAVYCFGAGIILSAYFLVH